jgi:hypothetical protein
VERERMPKQLMDCIARGTRSIGRPKLLRNDLYLIEESSGLKVRNLDVVIVDDDDDHHHECENYTLLAKLRDGFSHTYSENKYSNSHSIT